MESAPVIRPFADVLRDINKGRVADDTACALAELIQAVQAHGKPGTLTLTIKVEPFKGSDTQITMAAHATAKLPKATPPAAVFFTDRHGNATRDDPDQQPLFGRPEVAQPDARIGETR